MPGLAGSGSFAASTQTSRSKAGTKTLYLYLLIISGSLFPLRFLPINYEWLTLAATIGISLYQAKRFGLGRLGDYRAVISILVIIIIYQSAKALVTPQSINLLQFLRSLYGQAVLGFAIAAMATSPLSRERIFAIANNVLLLLVVLVLASVATGFQFYATGFMPDGESGDIRDVISSGNYRIITYYSSFVVFLFFCNLVMFFRTSTPKAASVVMACLVLIVLSGTRSLIAPSFAVAILLMLRYARPNSSITISMMVGGLFLLTYAAIPSIVEAYLSRFYVGEAFDAWRALEQDLVIQAIKTAPIFGLPMGSPYSHVMSALAGGTEGYRVNADYDMHNEYLWLMLYFGIVGCSMLFVLVFLIAKVVYRNSRGSVFSVAFFAYLLVMLASMNYSGSLLKGYGALLFGLLAGLCGGCASASQDIHLRDPGQPDPSRKGGSS